MSIHTKRLSYSISHMASGKKKTKLPQKITSWHVISLLFICAVLPFIVLIFQHQQKLPQQMASVATPQPVGQTGIWNLIFDDEFNGTTLDTTKWSVCLPWYSPNPGCPGANASEQELYMPDDLVVSNDTLKLHAEKRDVIYNGKTYHYTSGMISTGGINGSTSSQFNYKYGYMEMRARVPKGQGFWPAFWELPTDTSWPPEIDALEILGNDITTTYMTYHYTDNTGAAAEDGIAWTGPDFSADWHTFAVDWEPNAIHWYVDGVERRAAYTDTATIANRPMYILANLSVGGSWPGNADSTTPFPSDLEIDYIRVWKQSTSTSTLSPTPKFTLTSSPETTWQHQGLQGEKLTKAEQGCLCFRLPIGLIYDPVGKMVLDPDEAVQEAVRLIFSLFNKLDFIQMSS